MNLRETPSYKWTSDSKWLKMNFTVILYTYAAFNISLLITDSTEEFHSWDTNTRLPIQEISYIYGTRKLFLVLNIPQLTPIVSHINPVHAFLKVHFNIIIPFTYMFSSGFFTFYLLTLEDSPLTVHSLLFLSHCSVYSIQCSKWAHMCRYTTPKLFWYLNFIPALTFFS